MKLIFSRKGFDGASGGVASPILPDGRLVSLPIPSRTDDFTFNDLNFPDVDLGTLVTDLTGQHFNAGSTVHLDPDLDREPFARLPGWRPALGQTGAAQTHLANRGVGAGDIFLFFGWFREVERVNRRWRYSANSPDLHIMFGWLEIGHVLPIGTDRQGALNLFPWITDHPHVAKPGAYDDGNNTLYIATERSIYLPTAPFGGGRFAKFAPKRQLTAAGMSRSKWQLPGWFHSSGRPALSYHEAPKRWQQDRDMVMLSTVGRGQEFVIDGDYYPELAAWTASIIRDSS